MEIFDSLTRKIRVVYPAKAKAWIQHNGIKVDQEGNIIGGRYIEVEKLSKESLIADGLGIIQVEDETTGKTYERGLTEKKVVEKKEVKKATRKPRAKKTK